MLDNGGLMLFDRSQVRINDGKLSVSDCRVLESRKSAALRVFRAPRRRLRRWRMAKISCSSSHQMPGWEGTC